MTDSIVLEGLTFFGRHGVRAAEQDLGQPFIVDLTLVRPLQAAGLSDDLTRTVDYGAVYATVKSIVEGPPCRLIETVAERIAGTLLEQYPVEAVRVCVSKPHAPIPGAVFSRVAVIVERQAKRA
ncbi:MAG: dihydroneopterin aldolase [Chloroflexi bacterium]|nr:dihydroneopterin aldolase [Chloroflexota bacterium]